MSPVLVTLLAAAVGAAGAVLGSVVVAFFNARREKRRLEFDQSQARREQSRRLLASYLQLVEEHRRRWVGVGTMSLRSREPSSDAEAREVERMYEEVRLVAPELGGVASRLFEAYRGLSIVCQGFPVADEAMQDRIDAQRHSADDTVFFLREQAFEAFAAYLAGARQFVKQENKMRSITASQAQNLMRYPDGVMPDDSSDMAEPVPPDELDEDGTTERR